MNQRFKTKILHIICQYRRNILSCYLSPLNLNVSNFYFEITDFSRKEILSYYYRAFNNQYPKYEAAGSIMEVSIFVSFTFAFSVAPRKPESCPVLSFLLAPPTLPQLVWESQDRAWCSWSPVGLLVPTPALSEADP